MLWILQKGFLFPHAQFLTARKKKEGEWDKNKIENFQIYLMIWIWQMRNEKHNKLMSTFSLIFNLISLRAFSQFEIRTWKASVPVVCKASAEVERVKDYFGSWINSCTSCKLSFMSLFFLSMIYTEKKPHSTQQFADKFTLSLKSIAYTFTRHKFPQLLP